jgi:hypothetical protein
MRHTLHETWNNLLQDAERAFAQQSPGVRYDDWSLGF